jgi:hypothetical protein
MNRRPADSGIFTMWRPADKPIQDKGEGKNNLMVVEPLSYDLPDKDVGAARVNQLGSESPCPSPQVEDPTVDDNQQTDNAAVQSPPEKILRPPPKSRSPKHQDLD